MSDRDTPSAAEVLFAEIEDELLGGEPTDATPAAQDDDSAAPSPEAHADDADDSSSPPRDEKGRFTAREAKADDAEPAQPETQATEAPTATADPAPPITAPEGVAPEAPAAAPQPFAVTVDKQAVPIPGAALFEEGLYIPTDALPRVKEILSRGIHHEQTRRQIDAERRAVAEERAVWEQQKAQPTDETLASRYLLEEMQGLAEALPPDLYAHLYDRVERRLLAAKVERYESGLAQTKQTFDAEAETRWKADNIAAWVEDLAQHPDVGGVLTPEHLAAIRDELLPVADSLFVEVQGQRAIKDDVLLRHLTNRAALVKQAREADARAKAEAARVAKAAQDAARFNAGTQGKPNTPAVPKPTAGAKVTAKVSDDYDPDWRSKWHGASLGDE